jgi:hypothetical protein
VVDQRLLGQPKLVGDGGDADAIEAALGEQPLGGLEKGGAGVAGRNVLGNLSSPGLTTYHLVRQAAYRLVRARGAPRKL